MTIRTWLVGGRDYAAGFRLYEVLGANPTLKRTLSFGPDSYNTACLAEELTALLRAGAGDVEVATLAEGWSKKTEPEKKQETKRPADAAQAVSVISAVGFGEKNPPATVPATSSLALLKAARRPLYDERTQLHARLELMATDEERRVAALRILDITEQLDATFAAEKHLAAHGTLPPAPRAAPAPVVLPADLAGLSWAELKARRPNLASLVSNLKKKPHRGADLAMAQGELARLDAALGAAKTTAGL